MAKGWRYVLATARDMEVITTFKECRNRTLTLDLNKGGSAGAVVPMSQQGSEKIYPWSTCLIAQRDDEPVWSGPVNSRSVDLSTGMVTFSAVGWFERLMKLQIQDALVQYTDKDAGYIVQQLLLMAITQDPRLPITIGTVEATQLRTITYTRGQSIGQAILDLVELEAGFDWYVHPLTRQLHIYAKRAAYRPNCNWIYAFDDRTGKPLPQSNLSNVVEDIDGDIVNDMRPIGAAGQVVGPVDVVSQDQYGVFQESPNIPEIVNNNILVAYAQAELAFRAEPQVRYTMTPKASSTKTVPRLGRDFDIGDITYLTVRRGWIQSFNMPQRIFGASLSISDVGDIETINNLQTRAS